MSLISTLRNWRRDRAAKSWQVADEQWRRVERALPFLDFLPPEDRPRLRELALGFLAEKEMSGAHGLEVTDDLRLAIALQACLPILNLGLDRYAGWVGIVVYPGDFVIPRSHMDEHGVVHEYEDTVLGEAWEGGPVLVSWPAEATPAPEGERVNVVIHEFAHKLDMANGVVDGMPRLHADMSRARWAEAFGAAYRDFCDYVDRGGDPWLDPYAAASPSEFFAVVSEAFFETPSLLREDMPEVYEQLSRYYRQDPAAGEQRVARNATGR